MSASLQQFVCVLVVAIQCLAADVAGAQVRPDLIGSALSIPYGVLRGDNVAVTATIRNAGTAPARSGWTLHVYFSLDPTITTSDLLIGAGIIPVSLPAGATTTQTVHVPVPANTPWGMYYVGVMLDAKNSLVESNESNNIIASTTRMGVIPKIDLVATAVTPPVTAAKGATTNVSVTIRNLGTETLADAIPSDLYLSADKTYATGDVAVGTFTIPPGLGPGASITLNAQIVVPANIQFQPWYVIVFVDGGGRMPESEETNNTLSSLAPVNPAYPDMVMAINRVPSQLASGINAGERVSVIMLVKNQGLAASPGSWRTRYTLWSNCHSNVVVPGLEFCTGLIATLGEFTQNVVVQASASKTLTEMIDIPRAIIPGPYYFVAEVDQAGEQAIGSNNRVQRRLDVVRPADLVPVGMQVPSQVDTRSTFDATLTVSNQGKLDIWQNWKSRVTLVNGSVTHVLGDYDFGIYQLAANGTGSGRVALTLPSSVGQGYYNLLVEIDKDQTIFEETSTGASGETNNTLGITFIRVQGVTDLSVVSLSQAGRVINVELLNAGPYGLSSNEADPYGGGTAKVTVTASTDALGQQVLATKQLTPTLLLNQKLTVPVEFPGIPSGTAFYVTATIDVPGSHVVDRNPANNRVVSQRYVWP